MKPSANKTNEGDRVSFGQADFDHDGLPDGNVTSIDEGRRGVDDYVRAYFDALVREELPDDLLAAVCGFR